MGGVGRAPGVILVAIEEQKQAVRRVALPRPCRDAHSGPAVRAVEKSEEDQNIVGALYAHGGGWRPPVVEKRRPRAATATLRWSATVFAERSLKKVCNFEYISGSTRAVFCRCREKFRDTVTLSFVCGNYCLTIN